MKKTNPFSLDFELEDRRSRMAKEKKFRSVSTDRDLFDLFKLLEDFKELTDAYVKENIGGIITGVTFTYLTAEFVRITPIIIPFISSILMKVLKSAFTRVIRRIWKLCDPNNWVFLLLDLKKDKR
ncbi:MAG: hypothetical protein DRN53_01135 [Thermoprotei archaeon]|nr:MAG: hypothetical protein DRN53_01135 [Thermoprotei archaeon]